MAALAGRVHLPGVRPSDRRWRPSDGRYECASCHGRASVTAGTIFDRDADTADRLPGTVEADETYIGGEEAGLAGGRAQGKKVLTGIAVEVSEPKGIGRCRTQLLADGSAESPHPFVTAAIAPGSRVITDGWQGYAGIARLGYAHERRSQRAAASGVRIPASCCWRCTGSPRWPNGGC